MKEGFLKALAGVVAFLTPLKVNIGAVCILVVADFLLGIWAAKSRDEAFSKERGFKTLRKLIGYPIALMVAAVAETQLFDGVLIMRILAGFIASAELISTLKHLAVITGLPFEDVFARLGNKKS